MNGSSDRRHAADAEAPPRVQGSFGLEVEGLSVRGGNRPLGGFGTLRVSAEVPASGPETGSLALRDLRIEPFPGLAEWLRRFGYTAVTADLSAESRYDRAAGRVELTSLSLAGRDIGGYVEEAKRKVAEQIQLPPGYTLAWSGQYEYLERAAARLRIVVPVTLANIFLLLYLNFR